MFEVEVISKRQKAMGVVGITLATTDGKPLPTFEPGAHIDLHLDNGLIRQYSLCHSPSQHNHYHIAVLHDEQSRGGSTYVHHNLKQGDRLTISEPKNLFELKTNSKCHLLFAGGIGITPLLSMAEYLAENDIDFELHYSAKSADKAAFHQQIQDSHYAKNVHFYFSDQKQRLTLDTVLAQQDPDSYIYVCGPEPYIDHILSGAADMGWPDHQLHREYFQVNTSGDGDDHAFELHLASSNITIKVTENQSALEALTQAGIDVPYACEQGVCGTCITRVIEGTPEHRDGYLTPEEHALNQEFTPCCSRAKSPSLTIDL